MKACAVAKLRSNANARSHSAMPWAARFVNIWTTPNMQVRTSMVRRDRQSLDQGRFGRCQTRDPVVSKKVRTYSAVNLCRADKRLYVVRYRAVRARSSKSRACAMYSGVSPLFQQALPWKYKSIELGCSEFSARRASAAMS